MKRTMDKIKAKRENTDGRSKMTMSAKPSLKQRGRTLLLSRRESWLLLSTEFETL